jgi:AcrR family transcriptional regulator
MRKGELTRQTILEHAVGLASKIGLEGLTIGRLAEELELSKSGLFAHFQAKEALQLQVLDCAAGRFIDAVVRPALTAPRGEPRIRRIFERWMEWPRSTKQAGGCFFVSAAAEFDDRPGPVRDRLVQLQKDWLDTIANSVRGAIAEGHFRADVDPEQFGHDLYGVMLGYHHAARLLGDAKAAHRARTAFEALLRAARPSAA